MESKDRKFDEMRILICELVDGSITPDKWIKLNEILANDSEAVNHYIDFLDIQVLIKSNISNNEKDFSTSLYSNEIQELAELWTQLAEDEKTAPEIELPIEKPQRELIQKVVYPPREKRKISKFNKVFLALNAAAIFFIVLFLKFVPPKSGVEVATLVDNIDAKWADVTGSMDNGARLATYSDVFVLKEGMAELLFDKNAKVVVEGPAEFELLSEDRIRLCYGKLYSIVPKEAIGFSVFTETSKIFDMGTEFGVEADFRGNTLLHVIEGSTILIAGKQSDQEGIPVNKGAAKKISAVSSKVSDVFCDYKYFVRDIDSKRDLVWKGENLSLASIVASCGGFQEVGSLIGLEPVKGKIIKTINKNSGRTNNAYNPIPQVKFIDGVFVPGGESAPTQITSLGHTIECPDSTGVFSHAISVYKGPIGNLHTTIPPVIIDGQEVVNDPIVVLHSNVGITFDLQAIRQSMPQLNLVSLRATGLPMKQYNPDMDFLVLVDGQVKYKREIEEIDSNRDPIPFNVIFSPQDRFLTLIVTNGPSGSFASDFFYLINPELCLTDGLGG